MNQQREFKDVHDRHCCKRHGCKYCDPDCTVVSGECEGIQCEDCYESPEIITIHYGSGYFNWQWPGTGFGETSFEIKDGKMRIDAECMGKERARQLLYAFVDKLIDDAEIT